MFSNTSALVTGLLGLLILVGGIIGYCKACSLPSLLSGIIAGPLLLIASIGLYLGKPWGQSMALLITGLLVLVFAWRFYKTGAVWPALIMGLLSLAALLLLIVLKKR